MIFYTHQLQPDVRGQHLILLVLQAEQQENDERLICLQMNWESLQWLKVVVLLLLVPSSPEVNLKHGSVPAEGE